MIRKIVPEGASTPVISESNSFESKLAEILTAVILKEEIADLKKKD